MGDTMRAWTLIFSRIELWRGSSRKTLLGFPSRGIVGSMGLCQLCGAKGAVALVGLLQLWEQWRELGQRRKVNSTGSASKSLLTATNLTEDVTEEASLLP